eukprot:TRINITY_DN64727_c0_g1_i1.p4 TRINITY_DN64727_c0_g1~~TRINITY_DN64727_c0_g1_i1.p4  ORF type:complete len:132 (+),score=7.66 TRINITY_DN64727_c0_g1_i1:185-580(+)
MLKENNILNKFIIKKNKILKIAENSFQNFFYLNNKFYNNKLLNYLLQTSKYNKKNLSILDLCTNLNCIIPHYCYHFNLSIAGNCRIRRTRQNKQKKKPTKQYTRIKQKNKRKTQTQKKRMEQKNNKKKIKR